MNALNVDETGLEVKDLETDAAFLGRPARARDLEEQSSGLRRLAHCFLETPDRLLTELVRSAVELCGADSAAVSVVRPDGTPEAYYEWIASAGVYSGFLHAMLPEEPSACGVCLVRNRPQLLRVTPKFFEILGVEALPVTDGLLFPWRVEDVRGTIFVLSHGRREAFNMEDVATMRLLADFAAMGVRQTKQRRLMLEREAASAAAKMANELAHEINNPLQSITNAVFLLSREAEGGARKKLVGALEENVSRLSQLVEKLLLLPGSSRE